MNHQNTMFDWGVINDFALPRTYLRPFVDIFSIYTVGRSFRATMSKEPTTAYIPTDTCASYYPSWVAGRPLYIETDIPGPC